MVAEKMAKTYKLWVHTNRGGPKTQPDILIPQKDFPGVVIGDILEIYHPEEEFSRLLLQVDDLPEDFQQKDTISIEQSIAAAFQLRAYKDVLVNKIEPQSVRLDMVELLFKDQYFHRSDMWRLVRTLKNKCVHLNKKIEFAELRCQVFEMWSKGEKVACGVITEDTRVVFRSSTAVVQIFIQMSSEMWDFDLNGDLYFEKAVNGFLSDLFVKWKEQNCCHDVTIVLFSRTYYDSQSLDDFPPDIRDCLQIDDFGYVYEDFYRVIVQNERYEEWSNTLKLLRRLFKEYPDYVLRYHQKNWPDWRIPNARNSTAAQGNFLETLNMSLNLFENYYLDRNFDRTGKVSVVITPGPGVFEVDRELTFITKQRTIDCGVGSDLVCMGEQPLHAVPLFKFRSKNVQSSVEVGDDYNIPHWMNHSFYTSKNQIQQQQNAKFVPRIKPPPDFLKMMEKNPPKLGAAGAPWRSEGGGDDDNFPFMDYDEYDAQVFKLPSRTYNRSLRSASFYGLKVASSSRRVPRTFAEARQMCGPRTRHVSDQPLEMRKESPDKKANMSSSAISIPSVPSAMDDLSYSVGCYPIIERAVSRESFDSSSSDDVSGQRLVVGSAGSPIGHSRLGGGFHIKRALINPFAPSRLQFKMTSNRRRWVHALPTDAKGVTVQPHHVQTSLSAVSQEAEEYTRSMPTPEEVQAAQLAVEARRHKSSLSHSGIMADVDGGETESTSLAAIRSVSSTNTSRPNSSTELGVQRSSSSMRQLFRSDRYIPWAQTGDHAWSPDLTTGVDWKSLTIPASLPITTDYFPDERSLKYDYVIADYSLLPDDVNADYWISPPDDKNLFYRRSPLTTMEVFRELISQRLGQGFQLIVSEKNLPKAKKSSSSGTPQYQHTKGLIRAREREHEEEYYLSIGRIFHKLKLKGPTITVTRYWPRHPQPQRNYTYRYRFQAPDSYCYDSSSTEFFNECLETYNWNYLDQYICTRGEADYGLTETLKYWRSRYLLLPTYYAATKKIIDGLSTRCDIYEEKSPADLKQQIANFVRFVEMLNKLKRSPQARRSKVPASGEGTDSSPGKPEQEVKEKEDKLSVTSPSVKLVEAMLDPQTGLSLIQGQQGLPSNCFISAEAVTWCQQNVAGVQSIVQATSLFQRLIEEGLVLHASGNPRHKFIYGFYFYYILHGKNKPDFQGHVVFPGSTYNTLFQNEWLEVSMLPGLADENMYDENFTDSEQPEKVEKFYLPSPSASPGKGQCSVLTAPTVSDDWREQTGLCKQGWGQQSATLLHKYVNVDVNAAAKSDRQEWGTARYNACYSPLCSFELQLQWMVATGCVLGELIYSWARKASTCGFHLIPVPVDPFALPNCVNSDPLRGPIFVPLAISTVDDGEGLFIGCSEDEKQNRLLQIQDAILKRFGFVPITVTLPASARAQSPTKSPPPYLSRLEAADYDHQYVHCTVGMFVLIPELKPSVTATPSLNSSTATLRHPPSPTVSVNFMKKSSSDLHKDYIARQHSTRQLEPNKQVGFLWSWNFMSSKRWRSMNTGYEDFQDKMLADFREFCKNSDNRLEDFLREAGFKM